MQEPPPIEECDLMLAEVARMDLVLARHLHQRALDTDEAAELADLTRSYTRVTRSMRQNLALVYKLKADRVRAERESVKHEVWLKSAQPFSDTSRWKTDEDVEYETRAQHLSEGVGRVISHVADGDKERHTELSHRFDRELDDWIEKPDFLDLDLDAHVRLACRRLGLPAEAAGRWENLPDPTFHPDPEVRDDSREDWDAEDDAEPDEAAPPPPPLSDTG